MLVIALLKRAKELGLSMYVFTDLHKNTTDIMYKYLEENKIPYDAVNNCPVTVPFGMCGKPYYNILLDDKAGLESAMITLEKFLNWLSAKQEPYTYPEDGKNKFLYDGSNK